MLRLRMQSESEGLPFGSKENGHVRSDHARSDHMRSGHVRGHMQVTNNLLGL